MAPFCCTIGTSGTLRWWSPHSFVQSALCGNICTNKPLNAHTGPGQYIVASQTDKSVSVRTFMGALIVLHRYSVCHTDGCCFCCRTDTTHQVVTLLNSLCANLLESPTKQCGQTSQSATRSSARALIHPAFYSTTTHTGQRSHKTSAKSRQTTGQVSLPQPKWVTICLRLLCALISVKVCLVCGQCEHTNRLTLSFEGTKYDNWQTHRWGFGCF